MQQIRLFHERIASSVIDARSLYHAKKQNSKFLNFTLDFVCTKELHYVCTKKEVKDE